MDRQLKANRGYWDELVPVHLASEFYDVEGFKRGKSTLDKVILEGVGDVRGKSLLHLQCHFGLDTLSWARLGAKVTGVDFSEPAIRAAKELASQIKIDASFVCFEIPELPHKLSDSFDIVFTSYGVIPWLPDLRKWAEVIHHFLKPGGLFYVADVHPFAYIFNEDNPRDLEVELPYFSKGPMKFKNKGSYADQDAVLKHTFHYEWMHTLSEIVNSLREAGLIIERLQEYPFTICRIFPLLEQSSDGFWRLPQGKELVPLMFTLRAVRA